MSRNLRKMLILSAVCLISAAALAQYESGVTNPSITNPAGRADTGYTNPSVTSPVGRGNVPVTTYQSGLVRSPNPINLEGNLIVTGNVGGGKHFRGTVPYNAVSDFGGRIGTGTVDEFLRRSTIPQDYYRGGLTPFYSQTGTVTRTVPGTQMVYVPPSSKVRSYQSGAGRTPFGLKQIRTTETTDGTETDRVGFYPMGVRDVDNYLALTEQEKEQQEKERLRRSRKYRMEYQQFRQEVDDAADRADRLRRELFGEELTPQQRREFTPEQMEGLAAARPSVRTIGPNIPELPPRPERPAAQQRDESQTRRQETGVYEKMIQEYREFEETYNELFPDYKLGEQPAEQKPYDVNMPATDPTKRKLEYRQAPRITSEPETRPEPAEKKEEMSELEIRAEARRILSELKSFAAYSQDKFNGYMRSAEQYMQQGKFYLAADAYSLASIYKPKDPLPYAGRSHALFAAGEYVSSALYLSRAIDIFNGYVDFDVDLPAMLGGMDIIEKRISDIKTWLDVSSAPELNFLLAYVYMQIDRLDKASEAIDAAHEQMSDVPAVRILKEAIERRMSR